MKKQDKKIKVLLADDHLVVRMGISAIISLVCPRAISCSISRSRAVRRGVLCSILDLDRVNVNVSCFCCAGSIVEDGFLRTV